MQTGGNITDPPSPMPLSNAGGLGEVAYFYRSFHRPVVYDIVRNLRQGFWTVLTEA